MTESELLELIADQENSGVEFKSDDLRPERLERERDASSEGRTGAVAVFRVVVREHTRECLPIDWAAAQVGLGAGSGR